MPDVTDMRGFISCLEEMGEIKTLRGVDLNLEVGALTERAAEKEGPALLFSHFKGYPEGFRIISNVFRTCRRTAPALGLPDDLKGVDFLHAWRKKLAAFKPVPVEQLEGGPIFENQMGEEEVVITFESLYELLRREKYRPELQKLDDDFYERALKYLKEKQVILNSQEGKDNIFAVNEVEKTRIQLRNIQNILKQIYEKREGKLLQLALFNSRNQASVHNESALLNEEVALFDETKCVLSRFRQGILYNLLSGNSPEPSLKKEKPLKTNDEINKDKPGLLKVRILAELPEFVGPDMQVYGPFDAEAVVDLPREISDVLIANNQAEVKE